MARAVGSLVVLSDEAYEENYERTTWRNKVLRIIHVATMYMPASEFFAKGMPTGYSPGYDEGVAPMPLYDLECVDGYECGNALYEWEIRSARRSEITRGERIA